MSAGPNEFKQFFERIRAGSPDAVQEFLHHYGRHILTVIRQKLNISLRTVFDSIDFLQDVWASFFSGELDRDFRDPSALMKYLVQMAHNKITDEVRRRLGKGRFNFQCESSLDGSARVEAAALAVPGATPGDQAAAKEEWERLLNRHSDHHARILRMRSEGHTCDEIAAALGLNKKTVYRHLQRITARYRS
jgi:RNA polymerase sigma-70 factor (ECF subfamily)